MMNIEEIEQDLIKTCDAVLAHGWTLVKTITIDASHKQCCALGAHLVVDMDERNFCYATIGRIKYDLSDRQASAFTNGFDGHIVHCDQEDLNPLYQLGLRLRKRYLTNEH